MDTSTLKILLQNKINGMEENYRLALQVGNLEYSVQLEHDIEETKITLSQL